MKKEKLKSKNGEVGQSIIEAVVAVSIVAVITVALVSAITVSIRNATYGKNKSLATKYVNEGIEAVRSIRDDDWLSFYDNAGIGTFIDHGLDHSSGQWQFNDSSDTPAANFTRIASLKRISIDIIEVKVIVSWSSSTTTPFTTEATTRFSKWK